MSLLQPKFCEGICGVSSAQTEIAHSGLILLLHSLYH